MNIIIDSQILLWSAFDTQKLTPKNRKYLIDQDNKVFVCSTSLWEISLKHAIGKLKSNDPNFIEKLRKAIIESEFETIHLNEDDALDFHKLKLRQHKDPFDRILIWQAIKRNMWLMSSDSEMPGYQDLGLKLI